MARFKQKSRNHNERTQFFPGGAEFLIKQKDLRKDETEKIIHLD